MQKNNSGKPKNTIPGVIVVDMPFPFKHKKLPLHVQRKDKDIKRQRDELQKKRQEHKRMEQEWKEEKQKLIQYEQQKKQEQAELDEEQARVNEEIFVMSIRKERIDAKMNPAIRQEKTKTLVKYLKCIPFTAGRTLQNIQFWGSEQFYFSLKIRLGVKLDRLFGRCPRQKAILDNLSRVVFFRKVRFEGEWVAVSLKEQFHMQRDQRRIPSMRRPSLYNPKRRQGQRYTLEVYALSGKNFHLQREYTQDQLVDWAMHSSVKNKKPAMRRNRPSLADYLATHQIAEEFSESQSSINDSSSSKSSLTIPEEQSEMSIDSAHESVRSICVNEGNCQYLSGRLPLLEYLPGCASATSGQNSQVAISTINQLQSTVPKLKSVNSAISSCESSRRVESLNKPFLSGMEKSLFSTHRPLQQIILLKDKQQLYLLPQYLEIPLKKSILEKAVARYRLKMKLKAERNKCLFYRILTLDTFYQTSMREIPDLSMPFLFVIKKYNRNNHMDITMSCDSIKIHPQHPTVISLNFLFHRQRIRPDDGLDQKIHHMFMPSTNGKYKHRASKTAYPKRRSISRPMQKAISIEPDKKSEISLKPQKEMDMSWNKFSPKLIERFEKFLANNLLSLNRQRFIDKRSFKTLIKCTICLQQYARRLISKRKYNQCQQQIKIETNYNSKTKIMVCVMHILSSNLTKVLVEDLRRSPCVPLCLQYDGKFKDIIIETVRDCRIYGELQSVHSRLGATLERVIDNQIQTRKRKERERPQKNRRALQRLLFLTIMRVKSRKNIFLVKKITQKGHHFVLLIRRDKHLRTMLACHLYDLLPGPSIDSSRLVKDMNSEYGGFKHSSVLVATCRHESAQKYKYQTIYLMEDFFANMDKKQIHNEFYIDQGIFLLKPPKEYQMHFIIRLMAIDINSDEVTKQIMNEQKEISINNSSGLRGTNLLPKTFSKPSLMPSKSQVLQVPKDQTRPRSKQKSKQNNKPSPAGNKRQQRYSKLKERARRTSLEDCDLVVTTMIKSTFLKDPVLQTRSKLSIGDTVSRVNQVYRIQGSSHETTLYYSLYKAENIFFYLQFYIVVRTTTAKGFKEQLKSIKKIKIYKKQLEDSDDNLIVKKAANLIHEKEHGLFVMTASHHTKDSLFHTKNDFDLAEVFNVNFVNQLLAQQGDGKHRYSVEPSSVAEKEEGKNSRNASVMI